MLLVGVSSLTSPIITHQAMFLPILLLASQMMDVLGRESAARKSGERLLTVMELRNFHKKMCVFFLLVHNG